MGDLGQFQPLYPEERVLAPLLEQAAELVADSHRLGGQAVASIVQALRPRWRAMNSYYTNKIEGQQTRPSDIERALHRDFDADADLAKKQRLAIAHMEVEEQVEKAVTAQPARDVFTSKMVCGIHRLLY